MESTCGDTEPMREERGPWYLLTGVIIGFFIGLVYAWVINPVEYENTEPAYLRADYKDQYRALIAVAYAADGSLARAKARLAELEDVDPRQVLAVQAQRALAEKNPEAEAYALGLLAVALNQEAPSGGAKTTPAAATPGTRTGTANPTPGGRQSASPAFTSPAATTATLRPTVTHTLRTPAPTFTPLPTRTTTPTAGAPFVLLDIQLVCDASQPSPLIMIQTIDAAGQPVPGVEIVVQWEGGEDHFFTGLKPELGLGYADFAMTPNVGYTLRLVDGGETEQGILATECEASSGERFWGSWRLVYVQR